MLTCVDGKGVCPSIRGINAGAVRAIRLRMIYTYNKLQAAWREEIHGKHEQENQARYEYLHEYRLMKLKDDFDCSYLRAKSFEKQTNLYPQKACCASAGAGRQDCTTAHLQGMRVR